MRTEGRLWLPGPRSSSDRSPASTRENPQNVAQVRPLATPSSLPGSTTEHPTPAPTLPTLSPLPRHQGAAAQGHCAPLSSPASPRHGALPTLPLSSLWRQRRSLPTGTGTGTGSWLRLQGSRARERPTRPTPKDTARVSLLLLPLLGLRYLHRKGTSGCADTNLRAQLPRPPRLRTVSTHCPPTPFGNPPPPIAKRPAAGPSQQAHDSLPGPPPSPAAEPGFPQSHQQGLRSLPPSRSPARGEHSGAADPRSAAAPAPRGCSPRPSGRLFPSS